MTVCRGSRTLLPSSADPPTLRASRTCAVTSCIWLRAEPGLKYKAALSVAHGAGLRVSEVITLKVSDIEKTCGSIFDHGHPINRARHLELVRNLTSPFLLRV